jgi:hypothetical protein
MTTFSWIDDAANRSIKPKPGIKATGFRIRPATFGDIDSIVEVDLQSFLSVYCEYEQDAEQLRQELRQKFIGRLQLVGGAWMPVLEVNSRIVGFMTCCPTDKNPDEFESWEETTDSGTLRTTYNPKGRNVYVVTLSVLPEGSAGKDMLFAHQIGKMLRGGFALGYFESRLPGLRSWVLTNRCGGEVTALSAMTSEQRTACAQEYFQSKVVIHGREVRRDRLIRLYERVGCRLIRVVPGAYRDAPSLDFGVVCVYDGATLFDGSILPVRLPQTRLTRWGFGVLMQGMARSPKLTAHLFN